MSTANPELKRLFIGYANQRTRFAEELKQQLRASSIVLPPSSRNLQWESETSLNDCLLAEETVLNDYRAALTQEIPNRAHFLIAAQYSLMEKAHTRMFKIARDLEKETAAV
ncbi:MAG: hypothetical protein SFY81_12615 [Verrucomicrobiota bacterium]|nr:hypothetical protein [Verrucomicrobiota bacterium]